MRISQVHVIARNAGRIAVRAPRTSVLGALALLALLAGLSLLAHGGSPAGAGSEPVSHVVLLENSVKDPGTLAADQAKRHGLRLTHVYRHAVKGYAAMGPASAAEAIRSEPTVRYVQADDPIETLGTGNTRLQRMGVVGNANFDIDDVDDYRVDADIAILDNGIPAGVSYLNMPERTSCTYPDPVRESEELQMPADPEDPAWMPSERLNEPEEPLPYGCLNDTGQPLANQNGHGQAMAARAGRIDGVSGDGIAPGARIWSVRVTPRSENFGGYKNPLSDPEHPEYDPEAPEYLPELGTAHVIAGLDWVAAHGSQINVVSMSIGCALKDHPYVVEGGKNDGACESTVIDEAIKTLIDQGIVVAAAAGNSGYDAETATPRNNPDVVTVSNVSDSDGVPGGLAGIVQCNNGSEQPDDWRRKGNGGPDDGSGSGLLVDIAVVTNCGGTSGATATFSGAAAALASQCDPDDRAGVEFIVDTLIAEGDSGEIEEGGWHDDSGDGWKEPLLNLHDEEVFDPVLLASPSNPEGEDEEPDPEGCEWRSHQAESDVDSDGRADLVALADDGATVFGGAYEGPALDPAQNGYDVEGATTSLEEDLDPALSDGTGHYAIDTADVDGDRHADLITAVGGEGFYVHPGDAEGSFGAGIKSLPGSTLKLDGSEGTLEPIAVSDVNGDGRADLVATHSSFLITFPGQADGTFGTAISSAKSLNSALLDSEGHYFLDAIDVTGEELDDPEAEPIDYNAKHSYADLVTINSDGKVRVYPGKADGKFGSPVTAAEIDPIMDDGEGEEPVGLGDVDRDRRADLLTLDGETLRLYKANADGTFAEPQVAYEGEVDSSLTDAEGEELIALLDYSRDGLADLVSVTDEGEILVYAAQRDFSFAEPVSQGEAPSVRHGGAHEFVAERPFLRRAGCGEADCVWQPPVHAPRFRSSAYPIAVSGDGFDSFAIPIGAYNCKQSTLAAPLAIHSTALALGATHAECTTSGGFKASVTMNSCSYLLHAQNTDPPYVGTVGVACGKEAEKIEYKVLFGSSVLCTTKVGPQQALAGIKLANTGEGNARSVAIEAEVSGLKQETSGSKCATEVASNGVLSGKATLGGKNEAEAQAPLFINGAEVP